MMTIPSVRDGWNEYLRLVLPAGAPPVQVQECRRAFFAGAAQVVLIMERIGEDDVSENAGVEILEATRQELQRFVAAVGTARER